MVGELVSKHVFFFGGCIMFTCPNKIGARWDVLFVLQSISGAKLIDEMIFKFCFGSLPLGCFWDNDITKKIRLPCKWSVFHRTDFFSCRSRMAKTYKA